jgi:hypothetical protein
MNQLKALQENFQDYLLEKNDFFAAQVVATPRINSKARLNIYQNAYGIRLMEILTSDFPILKKILGEEKFNKIAQDYVSAFPSQNFSIRYFGQNFSKFIAQHSEIKSEHIEMASFEWALGAALDAADAPILTIEEMIQLPSEAWENLSLIPHSSLSSITLNYNIPEVWQQLSENNALCKFHSTEKITWLIWRKEQSICFNPTNQEEALIIQTFCEGKNFSEVCAGLCDWFDEEQVIQIATETLSHWIVQGIFSKVLY